MSGEISAGFGTPFLGLSLVFNVVHLQDLITVMIDNLHSDFACLRGCKRSTFGVIKGFPRLLTNLRLQHLLEIFIRLIRVRTRKVGVANKKGGTVTALSSISSPVSNLTVFCVIFIGRVSFSVFIVKAPCLVICPGYLICSEHR